MRRRTGHCIASGKRLRDEERLIGGVGDLLMLLTYARSKMSSKSIPSPFLTTTRSPGSFMASWHPFSDQTVLLRIFVRCRVPIIWPCKICSSWRWVSSWLPQKSHGSNHSLIGGQRILSLNPILFVQQHYKTIGIDQLINISGKQIIDNDTYQKMLK